jgi:hypothetical protein
MEALPTKLSSPWNIAMKRRLLVAFTVAILLFSATAESTYAFNKGGGGGRGFGGRGCGRGGLGGFGGIGFLGGGGGCGWDIAELYHQLYNNLPYFALHPPVYYSCPVARTYGYSPFAYPPGVMTPDINLSAVPVTVNNPYAPAVQNPAAATPSPDRAAAVRPAVEPLVIINPYVADRGAVAASNQ